MKTISLFKTTLGNFQLTINPDSHQSHIIFRVEVPKSTQELMIHYSYSPTEETVEGNLDYIFSRYQSDNNMAADDRDSILSVRNLITISAHSNQGFEGSCHRFEPTGTIIINQTASSKGMNSREIEPGFWDISLNLHSVVTPKTEVHCVIEAVHEEESMVHPPIQILEMKKLPLNRERNKDVPLHFQKVELHSHTHHSDAVHTTTELINEAMKQEINWLAITDHNTLSAFDEVSGIQHSIPLIKGMEMTTFFGHFLTLGYQNQRPMDWTSIDRFTINEKLKELKEQGLIIGIAHPFDVGSPYCTGCRWQYVLETLEHIDFIEVWNSEDPHLSLSNADAVAKWTQLLNAGIEIAATCGRDWHHSNTTKVPASFYVLANHHAVEKEILEAVKLGRSYMTLSAEIDLAINDEWTIGDRISLADREEMLLQVRLTHADDVDVVRIESNLGDLYETNQVDILYKLSRIHDLRWLRVSAFDKELNRILMTNPVYFTENETREGGVRYGGHN